MSTRKIVLEFKQKGIAIYQEKEIETMKPNPDVTTNQKVEKQESLDNVLKTSNHDKTYDPDQIDSVIDVINDADPIDKGENAVDTECDNKHNDRTSRVVMPPLFSTKREKRKKKAKIMMAIMCGIAVYCTEIVFALIMVNFLSTVMTTIMCNIIIATFSSIVSIAGIAAYGYVARTIS